MTAILFAVFHFANGWPWQAALVGTTTGSLLFGLVFVRWRSVPAAVGVHVAGNWMRDLILLDPQEQRRCSVPSHRDRGEAASSWPRRSSGRA